MEQEDSTSSEPMDEGARNLDLAMQEAADKGGCCGRVELKGEALAMALAVGSTPPNHRQQLQLTDDGYNPQGSVLAAAGMQMRPGGHLEEWPAIGTAPAKNKQRSPGGTPKSKRTALPKQKQSQ